MTSSILQIDQGDVRPGRDPRLYIAIAVMGVLAFLFWTGSRYPALNEKAMMGGETPLSGLAFDIVYDIMPDSPLWWSLVANSINWIVTNIKGMTFGVLFGAALLTLLSLVTRRSFKNGFANSALGAAIGAPLGVCVNCAVPIAVGLHMGRMRLETTLSAMMASPTLNVIVVSMTFALLPMHMAIIKLVLALVMVLLVVPLLCRFILRQETARTAEDFGSMAHVSEPTGITGWLARRLAPKQAGPRPDGLLLSIWWYARAFASNLFTIAIITVPMMFAAAVLGAVIASFFDTNELAGALPTGGMMTLPLALFAVALIAAFVPAPIALDVILTIVLINIGLRGEYAMAALIALGSTSIYAVIVLWRVISPRTAIVIFGSVIGLAMLGGLIARYAGPWEEQRNRDLLFARAAQIEGMVLPEAPAAPDTMPLTELEARSAVQALARETLPATIESSAGSAIAIEQLSYPAGTTSTIAAGDTRFTRIAGRHMGLADSGIVTPMHEVDTYMFGGGIAAADVDGDGWDDIAFRRPAGATGLSLYRNIGGSFARQDIALGRFADAEFLAVALADWNGDGAPELIASTRTGEVLVINNRAGRFDLGDGFVLSLPAHMRAAALAFADFDADGRLDMAIGAWTSLIGREGMSNGVLPDSVVYMAWNDGASAPVLAALPVTPGQTLALLAHDIDGNGYPDLIKGDDIAGTDETLFFGPDRTTLPFDLASQPFPYGTRTSMGVTMGDWNGDLVADFYHVQISDRDMAARDDLRFGGVHMQLCRQAARDLGWEQDDRIRSCALAMRSADSVRQSNAGARFSCEGVTYQADQDVCVAMAVLTSLDRRTFDDPGLSPQHAREQCLALIGSTVIGQEFCPNIGVPRVDRLLGEARDARHPLMIPQGNLLFTGNASGAFSEAAEAAGVRMPGWSWNSRFTDLDQDGREDILVMTGIWLSPSKSTPNVFYRNRGDGFANASEEFGLGDIYPSYSYALTDFDRDGDVDVIRPPESFSAVVHRNDAPTGNALWVRLDDALGNRAGIGSTVTICTSGATAVSPANCQRRWITMGGGYMSFDAPRAHFGLGEASSVSLIEVQWPDGEATRIRPENLSGGEVVIARR